ncbi:MAG: hypothetical protein ACFFF4_18830 [Candidatus Thorarchaeota archaeon]
MYSNDRTQATCPYCGNTYSYSQNEMQEGGLVSCRGCGSIIETQRKPAFDTTTTRTSGTTYTQPPPTYRKSGSTGTTIGCAICVVLLITPLWMGIPLAICLGLWYMQQNKEQEPNQAW